VTPVAQELRRLKDRPPRLSIVEESIEEELRIQRFVGFDFTL